MKLTLPLLLIIAALQTCLCLQSKEFTFIDSQIYFDLSTYNFTAGRTEVYEYRLTARQGNKVSLYLFQNNAKQYNIAAFDGDSDQGFVLPITYPTNKFFMEAPNPIVSLSSKMFIRVTADQSNLTAEVDFQAVATDNTNPAVCDRQVINVNVKDQHSGSVKFPTDKRSCFYLLHANDPTNNPMLAQFVVSNPQDLNNFFLYKGTIFNSRHYLVKNDVTTWASDKYIIIWPLQTVSLDFAWTYIGNLDVNQKLAPYAIGQLMTNDYCQDNYPNLPKALSQTFILNLIPPMKQIQFTYQRMLSNGTLIVNVYSNNKQINTTFYTAVDITEPFNITYECDKLELKYSTQNRYTVENGFYGLYQDVTSYPSTISTTTIQTTTKVAGSLFYLINFFLSLLLLVF